MSHKRNEALRHVQHSMHHVIAAGEGSDRAPDSCKLCPYYRPDFKFRTCLYAHCPYKKQVNVFRSTPEKWDILYVNKYITGKPGDYEVPGEYLDDETFAAMLAEAQKYIGYPYVWGGSSPATSFDCSGYVSWVINHSGWNVGRLGAQGLYNICTPTSSPKPGDLVFFKGTYDTPGVSHCGIYVGDGKMLHCGDPIGYANLNTSYWQSHFYAYGRLP